MTIPRLKREVYILNGIYAVLSFLWIVGLKLWYQTATANDLGWVLKPTAKLVSWISGIQFHFVAFEGFYSADSADLISKDCSGFNFFIISVTLAIFTFLSTTSRLKKKVRIYISLVLVSYLFTILVNSARILCAITLTSKQDLFLSLGVDQYVHKTEGVFVYLFFLIFYFLFLNGGFHGSKKAT